MILLLLLTLIRPNPAHTPSRAVATKCWHNDTSHDSSRNLLDRRIYGGRGLFPLEGEPQRERRRDPRVRRASSARTARQAKVVAWRERRRSAENEWEPSALSLVDNGRLTGGGADDDAVSADVSQEESADPQITGRLESSTRLELAPEASQPLSARTLIFGHNRVPIAEQRRSLGSAAHLPRVPSRRHGKLSAPKTRPIVGLTPGLTRPLSTRTVCSVRWSLDRRHVTLGMKREIFAAYGIPWAKHAQYEVDHFIPRELGGADDVRNLWPQIWVGAQNAHMKDRLENYLHRAVCRGDMTLTFAQDAIREDWVAAFRLYVATK